MKTMGTGENRSWTRRVGRWWAGVVPWIAIALIGAAVGFLGGLFGKGGSAVATPLLAAVGVPPIVAVASPLPATVPATFVAYRRYRRLGLADPETIRWSIAVGVPATVVGALATRWIDGAVLVARDRGGRGRSSGAASSCGPTPTRWCGTSPGRDCAWWRWPSPWGCSAACWPTPAGSCSYRSTWPCCGCRSSRRWRVAGRGLGAGHPGHARARRPRPHRLDGDGGVRGGVDPAVAASALARRCGCDPGRWSGSTAPGCWSSAWACWSWGGLRLRVGGWSGVALGRPMTSGRPVVSMGSGWHGCRRARVGGDLMALPEIVDRATWRGCSDRAAGRGEGDDQGARRPQHQAAAAADGPHREGLPVRRSRPGRSGCSTCSRAAGS